jgi:hypothetical protein
MIIISYCFLYVLITILIIQNQLILAFLYLLS